jgi:4-alpha-glucanotransferase
MKRTSGVLLHFTSLPTAHGIGDLGPAAVRFADFLARAGQSHWQVLPCGPTSTSIGNSPYSACSAFGGNTLLVSPELLAEDGLCTPGEAAEAALPASGPVDYESATRAKERLLRRVFDRERDGLLADPAFEAFLEEHAFWLNDLAFFLACKADLGGAPWWRWPAPLRDRHENALAETGTRLAGEILFHKFGQYLFFTQLAALKGELGERGIGLIGDAPIYVTHDSPDVWCNRRLFKLDDAGMPLHVAGVPPDYFSKTGQRWGNPVYDWRANRAEGYAWWTSRLRHNFAQFDQVRLDHFRGFAAYWEVAAGEKTAVRGRWVASPGAELLETVRRAHGSLPLIAEDLGIITRDVAALRRFFGLPGMRVLQFAFGKNLAENPNAPHRHEPDAVVYVGTHDNNTATGWFADEADRETRMRLGRYLGREATGANAAWALMELAMKSVAGQCVVTAQDLLGLGSGARMNTPGEAKGNWTWRLDEVGMRRLEDEAQGRLADLAAFYGRDGVDVDFDELDEPPVPF